ncbi:hypothetical protein PQR34_36025 [Paraburkholderia sediminicola]|uniref:hypothetical protein n=1 Tax=Paraburkholderia sediminicola TaxID=458836 RepID=UPI0038BB9FD5
MTEEKKVQYVNIDGAKALRAGGLLADFSMCRIRCGWGIMLHVVGEPAMMALLPRDQNEGIDDAGIFRTADEALGAVYETGFDVSSNSLGLWRPDPRGMNELLNRSLALLRKSAE